MGDMTEGHSSSTDGYDRLKCDGMDIYMHSFWFHLQTKARSSSILYQTMKHTFNIIMMIMWSTQSASLSYDYGQHLWITKKMKMKNELHLDTPRAKLNDSLIVTSYFIPSLVVT